MTDDRKQDHIDLAFDSRPEGQVALGEIYYEPLLGHLNPPTPKEYTFAGGKVCYPFWVSSMTGGTEKANRINRNLAQACREFGLGMGLGSCRPLLNDIRWEDFQVREYLGPDRPLYSNFGIAQVEELVSSGQLSKLDEITKKLQANGIIVHINPLQEFAQPEGDRYNETPLDTIKRLLDVTAFPIIVKEVGQGMGPKSLAALLKLPIKAIEFGAFGGTNFTLLEHARHQKTDDLNRELLSTLGNIGHSAEEMISWINGFDFDFKCQQFIISGGISNPIQARVLNETLNYPSVVGMASQFLKYSMGEYDELQNYMKQMLEVYRLSSQLLVKG